MIDLIVPLLLLLAWIAGGLALWQRRKGRATPSGRTLRVTLLALTGVLLIVTVSWRLTKSRTLQCFGALVPRVDTAEPVVALTFDDGPSAAFTGEVLTTLREAEVKATFFVVGQEVVRNRAEAQQIVAEGHELGNHTYSHEAMVLKPYGFIREEIESTDSLIRAAGYEGTIHFRSPYFKKFIALPFYLERTGRLNILADVEPESYREVAADADRIVAHVLERARPGSIILLHVMAPQRAATREALPGIIQGLRAQGYRFVTVSELLALSE